MSPTPLRVLHLEDDPADARLVRHELEKAGFAPTVTVVEDEPAFAAALTAGPDVVLCDWNLPAFSATRALEIAAERCPDIPVVIVSGSIGEEAAVRAIKLGAADYLLKDRLGRLGLAVEQSLAQRDVRDAERRAQERYRALADGIPQIVWTARPDGHIDYVNRWACEYTGLDATALAGLAFHRLVHPDDVTRTLAVWNETLRSGTSQQNEYRIRRADGEYRWHLARQVAVRDATGEIVQWIGTGTDIHDQKTAAEILARDAQILAGVRDAVVVTDLNEIVTYWNQGAANLFGWTAEEMVGRPYTDRFPSAVREEIERHVREWVAGGEWSGEYEDYRKDGTRVWTDARVRRFDRPDDAPAGVLWVAHDISERRQLEEQFRQAQKMEAIGRLAGGVAHDFNNLLTVINGYADLLLASDLPAGDGRRQSVLSIRDAGERAAGLTAQLLAFSRRAVSAPRVLDVRDATVGVERLLHRLIGEDMALSVSLPPAPCWVELDPNQLDQVLLNLAVNARDAMPGGGRLTLTVEAAARPDGVRTALGDLPPGRYVEVAVSDTGCGMTDAVKARIFEPFFTTKETGRGTGLGLAVVHGVVQQAGGGILVESEVGVGTTFRLLFPEVAPPQTKCEAASRSAVTTGTETVLLVEDEEAVRMIGRLALESHGYRVLEAECGADALRVADGAGDVHLLVSDVVMPQMNGRELADVLRARHPDLRVLFVSGYTDDTVFLDGVRTAADAFLQKPFSPLGLARKVREVLDTQSS